MGPNSQLHKIIITVQAIRDDTVDEQTKTVTERFGTIDDTSSMVITNSAKF
jgi:hypothetical protein